VPNRRENRPPKSLDDYLESPEEFQQTWNNTTHAVSRVREGATLSQASREFDIDPREVVRLAGSALRKNKKGRYVAKPSDRLLRVLVIPTYQGLREIAVTDSREASVVGSYSAAVQRYLQTGDAERVQSFRGRYVTTADGERIVLLTDLDELDRLGSAGVLSFESIYATVG
jgi:hypothetical protein